MHEHGVSGRPVQNRRASERRPAPRRRGSGPRPVRPVVNAVAVRPAEVERPRLQRSGPGRRAPLRAPAARWLVRRPLAAPPAAGALGRVGRFLAGLAVAVVSAALVVGLGLLADRVAASRGEEARPPVPAERIVTDHSLAPVSQAPGQVLRVTSD